MTAKTRPAEGLLRRSQRYGAKVRKIDYRGRAAGFARECLEFDAALKQAEAESDQRKRQTQDELERLLTTASDLIAALIDAAFFSEGLHRPSRHCFRPWLCGRRVLAHTQQSGLKPARFSLTATADTPNAEPASVMELQHGVMLARSGDATALPRIRELLVHDADIWRRIAALAKEAETKAVRYLADGDAGQQQICRDIAELRVIHAGEGCSTLRHRLIDRGVLDHLMLLLLCHRLGPRPWNQKKMRRVAAAKRREQAAWDHYHELELILPQIEPPQRHVRLFAASLEDQASAG